MILLLVSLHSTWPRADTADALNASILKISKGRILRMCSKFLKKAGLMAYTTKEGLHSCNPYFFFGGEESIGWP